MVILLFTLTSWFLVHFKCNELQLRVKNMEDVSLNTHTHTHSQRAEVGHTESLPLALNQQTSISP